jgi:hypothetical protein
MPLPRLAAHCLLLALLLPGAVLAVDEPSTYPGCANRSVTVPWGGRVAVDLKDCHSFGLGDVAKAPAHGRATPGANGPVDVYQYVHGGGTPAGGGRDRFVVRDDNSDLITVDVSIQAPTSAITVNPAALPPLQAGRPASLALTAEGGRAPYAYRVASGALPAGLRLAADGRLAGTPTARGAYAFDLAVKDAGGTETRRGFGGTVAPGPLAISAATATAARGQPFRLAFAARGGLAPHRFSLESGPLPEGLRLSPDGVLSGTPEAPPGRYPLTLRITDASTGDGEHFEVEAFTLQVAPPAPPKSDGRP